MNMTLSNAVKELIYLFLCRISESIVYLDVHTIHQLRL